MRMTEKQAFTLIELLVSILIIGILAAVALPQYQKAVKKAHMAEALTIMDANSKDAQAYLLEHGELANWENMISSYAEQLNITGNRTFGTYFQIGCASPNSVSIDSDFYCIQPKNGDKAYIYHFIDNTGKVTRICAGEDCGQYVTGANCFASGPAWAGGRSSCTMADVARLSGCSF